MAAQRGNRGSLEEMEQDIYTKRSVTGTLVSNTGNSQFYNKFGITLHNTSLDESQLESSETVNRKSSTSTSISSRSVVMKKITNLDDCGTKFPKLEECAHFHYDFVELGNIQVALSNENQENQSEPVFYIEVTSRDKTWTISRSYDNLRTFDRQLHKCIFDRKFSLLPELRKNELTEDGVLAMKKLLILYLKRFTSLAGNMINCGPVLSWLELDNRGNRLIISDDSAINTPAVGAAHVIKRYSAQDRDEISLEVGDIISIIDMPPKEESQWWRGKKGFEVGFFPAECVELIREKLPQAVTSKCTQAKPKPVLHKHGKLISLLRSFFTSRPARTQLKRSGIMRERVFGCDLGEHLLNTGREIPLVLECCAETIEKHGIVDGIYRLSGVASNIQKLRNEFDEERVPCLTDECYLQDIHSISSLLKAYFRDLPNPLFTFQLYDKFMAAIQDEENKLIQIHDVIQQLPPPHYRTAKYLMTHLQRISQHGRQTGMHCKNLAIVWAPNLLRSKDLELVCSTAALQGVGVQAIVTEYLISHADLIFSDQLQHLSAVGCAAGGSLPRGRPKSLALSTPTKLLSLEEARAMVSTGGSPKQNYIEVGGGTANLPDRYHTVIDLPSKKKSRKDRKSPSGWRSLFSKKGQTSKVKDSGSSDSTDVPSAIDFSDRFCCDPQAGNGMHKLRSVRSADSLLNETTRQTSYNRLLDDGDDGSMTFVNPYTDQCQPKLRRHFMDGVDSQRSVSANTSYSESEMEPIIDVSPRDEVFVSSEASGERCTDVVCQMQGQLECGSLPAIPLSPAHKSVTRPRSQLLTGLANTESNSEPQTAKRTKSTGFGQHDAKCCFQEPILTQEQISSNDVVEDHRRSKVKVSSLTKRKKAKAQLSATSQHPPESSEDDPERNVDTLDVLVTVDLTESPGVKRKLYSGSVVMDTEGLEGAPGQLASCDNSFTDDEVFNTQNLSLITDSETEVEKHESLSTMEYTPSRNTAEAAISDVQITRLSDCSVEAQRVASSGSDTLAGDAELRYTADVMERSLDSILEHGTNGCYSSDDNAQQEATRSFGSNSDGQVSALTMSTNFTTSSELPCMSSTSEDEVTSKQLYAISLTCSSQRRPLFKRLVDYDLTSESDSFCDRDQATPVAMASSPDLCAPSDSDTEVAKTPDRSTLSGDEKIDGIVPHIDLTEEEVVFVHPDVLLSPVASDAMESNDDRHLAMASEVGGERSAARGDLPPLLRVSSLEETGSLSSYSDVSDPVLADVKSANRLMQIQGQKSGDGYLADRSCSASPAFVETQDSSTEKPYGKDQDISTAMPMMLDTATVETTPQRLIEHKPETSLEGMATKSESVTEKADLEKASDSLLFEMEDIDSNQEKSLKSVHKLGASSENEEEFFCPQPDKSRTEVNMSVSPDDYLERHVTSEQKVEDSGRSRKSGSEQGSSGETTDQQTSSVAEDVTRKQQSDLTRKQSVRELLSRFEASAQSGELSDDGARSSSSENTEPKTVRSYLKKDPHKIIGVSSACPQTQISSVKSKLLPRKPSEEIAMKIREIQSGYSSSEDGDVSRLLPHECSSLRDEHSSDTDSKNVLSASSCSHDLQRKFDKSDSMAVKEQDGSHLARQSNDGNPKADLAKNIHQQAETLSLASSTRLTDDDQQTSADSVFNSSKLKRSTLSERLQNLSNQFKMYNEDLKPADSEQNKDVPQTQPTRPEQRTRPVPKPRSRTHRKPLSKGHFTRYDTALTRQVEPMADTQTSTSSGNESSTAAASGSLMERWRRFEDFSTFDKHAAPSCEEKTKKNVEMSCSLPEPVTGHLLTNIPSDLTSSVNQVGVQDKTLEIEGSNSQKVVDYKSVTLPRHSNRQSHHVAETKSPLVTENVEKKHVSVRDLSRQFEQQMSEQSDTSRTSTLSRASGSSCASDLANGSRTVDAEQTSHVSLNRNMTTQNWTTIL